jgi:predicted nucleic acid-binding protein
MIVIDSSVWIDYFRGTDSPQAEKLDSLIGKTRLAIGDLIMVEVLQGFANKRLLKEATNLFGTLDFVLLGGRSLALNAAANYRKLRASGYTVRKTIDVIIATRCIMSDYELLHNDRDFLPFEQHLGLKCVV